MTKATAFFIILFIFGFTVSPFYFGFADTLFSDNKALADGMMASPTLTPSPTPSSTIINLSPEPLPKDESEINLSENADAFYGGRDVDCDGIRSSEDNCPFTYNPVQKDKDKNGVGDACDGSNRGKVESRCDSDADGVLDFQDNCPLVCNPDQKDQNKNGIGDVCDPWPLPDWVRIRPCSDKLKKRSATEGVRVEHFFAVSPTEG